MKLLYFAFVAQLSVLQSSAFFTRNLQDKENIVATDQEADADRSLIDLKNPADDHVSNPLPTPMPPGMPQISFPVWPQDSVQTVTDVKLPLPTTSPVDPPLRIIGKVTEDEGIVLPTISDLADAPVTAMHPGMPPVKSPVKAQAPVFIHPPPRPTLVPADNGSDFLGPYEFIEIPFEPLPNPPSPNVPTPPTPLPTPGVPPTDPMDSTDPEGPFTDWYILHEVLPDLPIFPTPPPPLLLRLRRPVTMKLYSNPKARSASSATRLVSRQPVQL
jgi:hypothetical protein